MATQSSITGAAGENYVLSELLRRNWVASFVPKNSKNIDILAMNEDGEKYFSVQVKAKRSGDWKLKEKHENIVSDTLFYVFIDLGKSSEDKVIPYILPSKIVANCIKDCHQVWLRNPSTKKGATRNDNPDRRLRMDYSGTNPSTDEDKEVISHYLKGWLDQYRENWDILPH